MRIRTRAAGRGGGSGGSGPGRRAICPAALLILAAMVGSCQCGPCGCRVRSSTGNQGRRRLNLGKVCRLSCLLPESAKGQTISSGNRYHRAQHKAPTTSSDGRQLSRIRGYNYRTRARFGPTKFFYPRRGYPARKTWNFPGVGRNGAILGAPDDRRGQPEYTAGGRKDAQTSANGGRAGREAVTRE